MNNDNLRRTKAKGRRENLYLTVFGMRSTRVVQRSPEHERDRLQWALRRVGVWGRGTKPQVVVSSYTRHLSQPLPFLSHLSFLHHALRRNAIATCPSDPSTSPATCNTVLFTLHSLCPKNRLIQSTAQTWTVVQYCCVVSLETRYTSSLHLACTSVTRVFGGRGRRGVCDDTAVGVNRPYCIV